jgi:hypothetical protein
MAAVKVKLNNYQHDYNERNFFFLPDVITTSERFSGDFLLKDIIRLLDLSNLTMLLNMGFGARGMGRWVVEVWA